MTKLTIFGVPLSSFVRTARMACHEKGAAYDLVPVMPGQEAEGARHPFGRVPFMRHGDLVLFESQAIARYVDRVFPGPALMPADPRAAAIADQWISAVCDYVPQSMLRTLVGPRIRNPLMGMPVDEAAIAAGAPLRRQHLAILDATLAKTDWLAGDALTLADLFLAPILYYVALTPEGTAELAGHAALARWRERMAARPSFKDTVPPLPEARSAA